ncbi:MAG: YhbY family RNA-binding protein [archaeon]|nr:YhbY family RNA-binding protein [archaeon]
MKLDKKEIMNRALNAMTINIGKAGINENVIEEIKRQFESNEILRIKFAKNVARDKDAYIDAIKEATRCQLVDVRGHVAVLYKRKP